MTPWHKNNFVALVTSIQTYVILRHHDIPVMVIVLISRVILVVVDGMAVQVVANVLLSI